MTLANTFKISIHHQRSTRIDNDFSSDFFPGLVYHGTAQNALETLLRQFKQTNQSSYTLTGPYGSGKSTIALLLAGILNADPVIKNAARKTLNKASLNLVDEVMPLKKGWLQIRAVGGVESPIETFWKATLVALKEHDNTSHLYTKFSSKRKPKISAELLKNWQELIAISKEYVDGILIIADEMGKTLEYINKNQGELHFFQDLAEYINRSESPIIFLGLLHQSFSEYAKDRGTKLQEEWGKIQGRYIDILYNVSADETVALIAKSIVCLDENFTDTTSYVNDVLAAIDDNQSRKLSLISRLNNVAPLSPLVALLLGPISKRRFSQNERSTFGFLNSQERHSFQLFLKNNDDVNARYTLANLWDYLETNLEHAILGSPDGHAWAEASEAIARIDVSEDALDLLKTIAMLNLFGKTANIYASEKLLLANSSFKDEKYLKQLLAELSATSSIAYRKHRNAWAIYEGSDIDIQSLLENKLEQLQNSTEALQHIKFSKQIIAKSHYHTSGILRWADLCIRPSIEEIDIKQLKLGNSAFAHFVLLLKPTEKDDLIQSAKYYKNEEYTVLRLAVAKNCDDILVFANELYALELLKNDPEIGSAIRHDKVALKEFDSRITHINKQLYNAINEGYLSAHWYDDKDLILFQSSLSEVASEIADEIYKDTPIILNELVNRNKLSGTAVAARKKLLESMLQNAHVENLGITGFPPEKSMYISCLKNTGIHRAQVGGRWKLSLPTERNIKVLFSNTSELLQMHKGKINLATIEKMWLEKPYGVSKGVFPILLLAYFKVLGEDIAFYEKSLSGDFEYLPELDSEFVQQLQKTPQNLAIKYVVLEKNDAEWLQKLSAYVATLTTQPVQEKLLSVIRPLVTTIHALPYWVKNATVISDNQIENRQIVKLRDALLQATDPHVLLIKDLIDILDPKDKLSQNEKIDILEKYISLLKEKHEKMLDDVNRKLKNYFPQCGDELINFCQIVESRTGDLKIKAFVRELAKSGDFGVKWLESIIAVVIGKGMTNWNENNLLTAEQGLAAFSQNCIRIYKAATENLVDGNNKHIQSKNISLVCENSDGQLITFSKEIFIQDENNILLWKENLNHQLKELNEFDRIHLLKSMLEDALQA